MLFKRTFHGRFIEYRTTLRIGSDKIQYFPFSFCYLLQKISIRIVQVKMIPSVAAALPYEFRSIARKKVKIMHRLDISAVPFFKQVFNQFP